MNEEIYCTNTSSSKSNSPFRVWIEMTVARFLLARLTISSTLVCMAAGIRCPSNLNLELNLTMKMNVANGQGWREWFAWMMLSFLATHLACRHYATIRSGTGWSFLFLFPLFFFVFYFLLFLALSRSFTLSPWQTLMAMWKAQIEFRHSLLLYRRSCSWILNTIKTLTFFNFDILPHLLFVCLSISSWAAFIYPIRNRSTGGCRSAHSSSLSSLAAPVGIYSKSSVPVDDDQTRPGWGEVRWGEVRWRLVIGSVGLNHWVGRSPINRIGTTTTDTTSTSYYIYISQYMTVYIIQHV